MCLQNSSSESVDSSEEITDTEDNDEEDLGVLDDQRSIILHLLSQLKLGMDLTRVHTHTHGYTHTHAHTHTHTRTHTHACARAHTHTHKLIMKLKLSGNNLAVPNLCTFALPFHIQTGTTQVYLYPLDLSFLVFYDLEIFIIRFLLLEHCGIHPHCVPYTKKERHIICFRSELMFICN